jgi:hypothetical protein
MEYIYSSYIPKYIPQRDYIPRGSGKNIYIPDIFLLYSECTNKNYILGIEYRREYSGARKHAFFGRGIYIPTGI